MKLEVGKKYRNRVGRVYEVISYKNDPIRVNKYIAKDVLSSETFSFTEEGRYGVGRLTDRDLVKEVKEYEYMNETKECIFEVGQTVWCTACGKGKVTAIKSGSGYVVQVMFNTSRIQFYTVEGKMFSEGLRTLFFSEPKVEGALVPPFVPTLEGKVVKTTDKDGRVSYIKVLQETEYTVFAHTNNALPYLGYVSQLLKSEYTFEPVN